MEIEIEEDYVDSVDASERSSQRQGKHPEMYVEKVTGWNMFSDEVAWFIYDFFKHDLNGYQKLIFYCYYINGMTLMEIASSADCSFQYIGAQIKIIETKLGKRWKTRDTWRATDDSE